MGAFDLIRKGVKGAKNAPFFSKVDEVLESLPRNKGTGDEFLREIEKTKGVKPAEIQDRGIAKALKGKPKMTKAEVQKIFESNPPPRVQEKVLKSDVPDYDEWLENKAQEIYGVDWFDLRKDEQAALNKMYGELPLTQYDRYKTPGGENYREILLKLPVNTANAKILEAGTNKTSGKPFVSFELNGERYVVEKTAGETDQQAVSRRIGGMPERGKVSGSDTYTSSHYKTDPNLLAHIRVQDFTTPEGKKVLLVDEIQSDWHQEGRKKGYRESYKSRFGDVGGQQLKVSDFIAQQGDEGLRWLENKNSVSRELGLPELTGDDLINIVTENGSPVLIKDARESDIAKMVKSHQQGVGSLEARERQLFEKAQQDKTPDAPFKKNWHELAMKRVLDYAAENGYDSIAITPGAEQAKRYDLSKQIGAIEYRKSGDDNYKIKVYDPVGQPMNLNIPNTLDASGLEQYIGKEMAEKVANQATGEMQSLAGLDLQVGGEGMKGFYDKILPDYLNNFGKPYGSSVGKIELKKPITRAWSIEDLYRDTGITPDQWQQMSVPERIALRDKHSADFSNREEFENYGTFHSFDITPQLREEVKTKGLPLYSKTGMGPEGLAAGTGAATIGSEVFDTNNEQQVQNPVHFTENPDAMLLELMQRN